MTPGSHGGDPPPPQTPVVRLLGSVQLVTADAEVVDFPSPAQRRLLALLALTPGSTFRPEYLSDLLEVSPGALRTTLSRLRARTGPEVVRTDPTGYRLVCATDAERFTALLVGASSAPDRLAALEDALALWRGPALDEFRHEPWAEADVARLEELRGVAVEDRAELLIGRARGGEAVASLEAHVAANPLRDRARALLIEALATEGRQAEALRAYQDYRTYLVAETGTEPSELVRSIERRVAAGWVGHAAGESDGVFLMTDIVGSTRLWAEEAQAMAHDLAEHDTLLSRIIAVHRGLTISRAGDSFTAVFERADDAVGAAIAAQEALASTTWHTTGGIRARIGVHRGTAQRRGDGWYGPPLNETARMTGVAHGGQIVVSEGIAGLVRDVELVDLGEHRLRDLDGTRRLFQVVGRGAAVEFPALRSLANYTTNLPDQLTSLVGREELVDQVRAALLDHRVVSLTGPGGVGKTRTAVEAAGRELAAYPDGVVFVDLTAAADGGEVLATVAGSLRASPPVDRSLQEHVVAHLRDRRALLVLDNCEHVVDDAAAVVDALVRGAPDVRVLATSREPLQLQGEQCVVVPSLEADGPASAAVRLFTERALAADRAAVVDDADLDTITEIARRLDGIPLAIELAAAQTRTLTPAQILTHLDERFRFLRRSHRQAPPRQRTLEAAVAWSYELLDAEHARAFRMLSVCAGPFTLATAARLLDVDELIAAELLDALVSKSLVAPVRVVGRVGGYRYLETLREYGRRALADADDVVDARARLESALLPPRALLDDWIALSNGYVCTSDLGILLEDVTRRDAAAYALGAGRLDAAALLFSSCAFRADSGTLTSTLRLVSPLVLRRTAMDPTAWVAACATKLTLERLTRRYAECLDTAMRVLVQLDADDPARGWFELWRCALTTAVAPELGLEMIADALPRAQEHARPPEDWTVSQLLCVQATGLALLDRLDEARRVAEDSLAWAPVGLESRDQALAVLLWIGYLSGSPPDDALRADAAAQHRELGLAELCAAPAAVCDDLPLEERAALLVAAARRRSPTDVPTPFLLAFAWLAVERGDEAHAVELAGTAELYDSSTQVALMHLLARLGGWSDETWAHERDAAVAAYLDPGHEAAAARGTLTLTAEVEAWERRLAAEPVSP